MTEKRGLPRLLSALGLALVATAASGAVSARAQAASDGFSLGVGGGFARENGMGYYMLSTLEFPSLLRVVRPRADLFYAETGGERVTGLTANTAVTLFSRKAVAPYLLAGAGAYATPGAGLKSGWTLGAGLRLPGELRTVRLESRVHAFLGANRQNQFDTNRWRYVWMPLGLAIHF